MVGIRWHDNNSVNKGSLVRRLRFETPGKLNDFQEHQSGFVITCNQYQAHTALRMSQNDRVIGGLWVCPSFERV